MPASQTIPTLSLSGTVGKPRHENAASSSVEETPGRATSRLRAGGGGLPTPGPAWPAPRTVSLVLTAADHHDGSPARTPSLGGAGGRGHGLTWPSAARGRRCLQCSRQSFAGAQRASLGAALRTLEPWAGGGGRPRMRTAGVQGAARHGPRASVRGRRVLPPAPPLSTPRPASRSPPLRRVGSGARRAARNCFHCKQKKATHDQAGGGEARGGRGGGSGRDGKRGPGDPGLRRGPLGRPFGQAGPLGSSATPGDRGDQGRWRVAGPPPLLQATRVVLRSWQRVAAALLPRPPALQGSKVKIKRITTRARLLRVRREDSTFLQLLLQHSRGGSNPQPPCTSCRGRKTDPQPPA